MTRESDVIQQNIKLKLPFENLVESAMRAHGHNLPVNFCIYFIYLVQSLVHIFRFLDKNSYNKDFFD